MPEADPARRTISGARLYWREKYLLIAAFVLLWHARMLLSIKGFGDPRIAASRIVELPPAPLPLSRRVAFAMDRAAMAVPSATCLVKAIAGQRLLAMKGRGSEIRIGVRKGNAPGFEAHAWLISGDTVVLGADNGGIDQYALLIGAN